jgi:gliding motility-associated-like protein
MLSAKYKFETAAVSICSFVALLLFAILFPQAARANHLYGADFSYKHINGNQYEVTLTAYGDCAGVSFGSLIGATPTVLVMDGTTIIDSFSLSAQGSGVEVTPVCAALRSGTTCTNPTNTISGVKRFVYKGRYLLPAASANWVFRFDGNLGNFNNMSSPAGRSMLISNIIDPAWTITALEARLNNLLAPNSSPTFTSLPTPFYCVNVAQQFNIGAVDPDQDQLAFALVRGLNGAAGVTRGGPLVNYASGYSAINPIAVTPGSFVFNSGSGQMNFTPNQVQTSLVVEEVEEKRNGVVVGSSMREMNFIVITNCNTTPAVSMIDSSGGGSFGGMRSDNTTFRTCTGVDSIGFSIRAYNPGNSAIDASFDGLPPGALMTISGNGTTAPVLNFKWANTGWNPGLHHFFISILSNSCPLSALQTTAFTIDIVKPNSAITQPLSQTECIHRAAVKFLFADGLQPRNVEILRGGNRIGQFVDSTGHHTDSLAAGAYVLRITTPELSCASADIPLTVPNSGAYPIKPGVNDVFFCKGTPSTNLVAKADSGAVLHWYSASGTALSSAPRPRTDTTGVFIWQVSQQLDVCESARDSVRVWVTPRPVASFAISPSPICLNDTATLQFNGSTGTGPILEYNWDFDGGTGNPDTGAGPIRMHWQTRGVRHISLQVAENRCSSALYSDSIIVKPVPFAAITAPDRICQNEVANLSYAGRIAPGMHFNWQVTGSTLRDFDGAGPTVVSWKDTGMQLISLRVDDEGCSDTQTRIIYVNPLPQARILNIPGQVCIGQTLHLQAAWQPFNSYIWSRSSAQYPVRGDTGFVVQLIQPERFRLEVTSSKGCVDSTSQTWTEVQPCCNFSYPNAFTPNNDGRNDQFKVVAYGNQLRFQMSIYNRWGQRVFYGSSVAEGWDGTFGGKQCEPGSYYYVVDAKCFTGYEEHHKGDLILVR